MPAARAALRLFHNRSCRLQLRSRWSSVCVVWRGSKIAQRLGTVRWRGLCVDNASLPAWMSYFPCRTTTPRPPLNSTTVWADRIPAPSRRVYHLRLDSRIRRVGCLVSKSWFAWSGSVSSLVGRRWMDLGLCSHWLDICLSMDRGLLKTKQSLHPAQVGINGS